MCNTRLGLAVETKNKIKLLTEDHLLHRQLSRDVMVTVLVQQSNETAAILLKKPQPPVGELTSTLFS